MKGMKGMVAETRHFFPWRVDFSKSASSHPVRNARLPRRIRPDLCCIPFRISRIISIVATVKDALKAALSEVCANGRWTVFVGPLSPARSQDRGAALFDDPDNRSLRRRLARLNEGTTCPIST